MTTCAVHKMVGASLAAGTLLAGCAVESSEDSLGSVSTDELSLRARGQCPNGWIEHDHLRVLCPEGTVLVARAFGQSSCVQCAEAEPPQAPRMCEGSWRNARLMFGCAPGFELEYSPDGRCKRCVAVAEQQDVPCQTDDDCFRTGCSGEICAAEHAVSTCIWRPEYRCYEDRFCGCNQGHCGFKDHPQLRRCVAEAQGD